MSTAKSDALSINDLCEGRLPNGLIVCLAAGVAHFFFGEAAHPSLADILLGLVVGPGALLLIQVLLQRFRGQPGLGIGDVKFAGAAAKTA